MIFNIELKYEYVIKTVATDTIKNVLHYIYYDMKVRSIYRLIVNTVKEI